MHQPDYLDLPYQVSNVPTKSLQLRALKVNLKKKTQDSQSSVLTPMFERGEKNRAGTPSGHSQSDFSFAAELNRKEKIANCKDSQSSNLSRTKPLPTNFL